jgi:hypothetical protein
MDPDFYFRSFEVFDNDVIKSLIDPDNFSMPVSNGLDYSELNQDGKSLVNKVKEKLIQNNGSINEIKEFLINEMDLKPAAAMNIFRLAVFDQENDTDLEKEILSTSGNLGNKYPKLWQDFIDTFIDEFGMISDVSFSLKRNGFEPLGHNLKDYLGDDVNIYIVYSIKIQSYSPNILDIDQLLSFKECEIELINRLREFGFIFRYSVNSINFIDIVLYHQDDIIDKKLYLNNIS